MAKTKDVPLTDTLAIKVANDIYNGHRNYYNRRVSTVLVNESLGRFALGFTPSLALLVGMLSGPVTTMFNREAGEHLWNTVNSLIFHHLETFLCGYAVAQFVGLAGYCATNGRNANFTRNIEVATAEDGKGALERNKIATIREAVGVKMLQDKSLSELSETREKLETATKRLEFWEKIIPSEEAIDELLKDAELARPEVLTAQQKACVATINQTLDLAVKDGLDPTGSRAMAVRTIHHLLTPEIV